MFFKKNPLISMLMLGLPVLAAAEEEKKVGVQEQVVVTASPMDDPLTTVTDPKAPRQPIPAHDGADELKTIPGFSVIRKGGIDGDPVLRGMAGSRLNVLLDGEQLLGGCGMRMDPPTAYVFPEAYDRMTVIKGPQSVIHGHGSSAGVVLYERDVQRFESPGVKFHGSQMFGGPGRNDELLDVRAGTRSFYVQGTGTHSRANDYEDGSGNLIHSRYSRFSANVSFGWTPDENTRLELSAARSKGEAAYADRGMDGSKFARENIGLKFEKSKLSPLFEKIEAQLYRNYIDHVMDDYTLRTNPGMHQAMNPDRTTQGARLSATLEVGQSVRVQLGSDLQRNEHTGRMTMNEAAMPYEEMRRTEDANFRDYGAFGELTYFAGEHGRAILGLRADRWRAEDKRAMVSMGMGGGSPNPTANHTRGDTLPSGFVRYERDLTAIEGTLYAGLGHTERAPDYWELIGKESEASLSSFDTLPEKTNQLDLGLIHKSGRLKTSISGFYSRVHDFILIESGYRKGMRTSTITRNVEATTWGGEAAANLVLAELWKLDGSLAYVRGSNDTDARPLAQLSPLEARLGLGYDSGTWSAGSLLRLVASQGRYSINQGNIVGQDLGRTDGFAVFSLNAGWRSSKGVLISGGIDNLFDKAYAEHVSRGAASVPGYEAPSVRVNEPGRTLWLKGNLNF